MRYIDDRASDPNRSNAHAGAESTRATNAVFKTARTDAPGRRGARSVDEPFARDGGYLPNEPDKPLTRYLSTARWKTITK